MLRFGDELSALGEAVRDPAVFSDAVSVSHVTMDRVATNIDRLVERLAAHGYEFGVYPDGACFPVKSSPRVRPEAGLRAHVAELEQLAGTIPMSLKAFWDVVGSVSLIGRARDGWLEYSDPLYVETPAGALADFRDWHADREMNGGAGDEVFFCPIAPDLLHKDNVSGGPPYSVALPNSDVDARLSREWHNVGFVPYLRIAILDWGGFPGLSPANPKNQWRSRNPDHAAPEWLTELKHDLVAF